MASQVFSPQGLYLLEHDPRFRLHIEALIIDYEAALHTAIGARACQIAKMRFRYQHRASYRPTRALSVERLLARIRALVKLCNNIERLAQIRAERLKRERDADPLGLAAHGSTDAWLRHAAHHEAVGVVSLSVGPEGLMVSSTRSVRPSNHEAVLTARATCPRGPPPTIVCNHPKPASQAHLRERAPVRIDKHSAFHHIPRILGGHADEAREARLIPRVVSTPASVHPCFPQ
jgi:hypothetical protein